jgi:glycerol-3-phosphate dehydrogenase
LSGLPLDPAVKSRWLERYGGNASRLADRAMGDAAAGRDLGAKQLTRAEVRYAVEEEMARTVTDFFTRRASVFYWALDGGLSVAGAVSAEMGRLLGWSSSEEEGQVESYREWVSANRMSPIGG